MWEDESENRAKSCRKWFRFVHDGQLKMPLLPCKKYWKICQVILHEESGGLLIKKTKRHFDTRHFNWPQAIIQIPFLTRFFLQYFVRFFTLARTLNQNWQLKFQLSLYKGCVYYINVLDVGIS